VHDPPIWYILSSFKSKRSAQHPDFEHLQSMPHLYPLFNITSNVHRSEKLFWRKCIAEQISGRGNASGLHSGDTKHETRPGNRLSWLRYYVVFLSPPRRIPTQNLKIGHDPFVPLLYILPFILILSSHSSYCPLDTTRLMIEGFDANIILRSDYVFKRV
jgi:hypothetical protein